MRPARRLVVLPVAWVVALVATHLLGLALQDRGARLVLGDAPPFIGALDLRVGPGLAAAVALVALVVAAGPAASRSWRWPVLLLAAWGAAAAFAVALAVSGVQPWTPEAAAAALTEPLRGPHDYLAVVPTAATDPAAFVRTYTESLPGYPIHVRGHPPGLVLLLVAMSGAGLGGAGWASALDVAVGSSAVVAVAVTARALAGAAGERAARRALPATVLAPAAIWVATSPDAFFAGVLAWGVALLALASTRRAGTWWLSLAAGALLAACPFLSYGLLPMGLLALVVPWATRRVGPTVVAGVVVLAAVALWALAGFWIGDGVAATHEAWSSGRASARPYLYFLLADVVLLGALVGPAGVAGLGAGWRGLPAAVRALVGVAVVAALAGALLGFMRGEVERIWLPLAPWVLLAAAVVGRRRGWLAVQGGTAVLLEAVLASPW